MNHINKVMLIRPIWVSYLADFQHPVLVSVLDRGIHHLHNLASIDGVKTRIGAHQRRGDHDNVLARARLVDLSDLRLRVGCRVAQKHNLQQSYTRVRATCNRRI